MNTAQILLLGEGDYPREREESILLEDDRPKIDFENAPYTYKPVDPDFVSGEELDAEGENKSKALNERAAHASTQR